MARMTFDTCGLLPNNSESRANGISGDITRVEVVQCNLQPVA